MSNFYLFDCPIHGLETQAFCFRAWSEEFFDRWRVYEITIKIPTKEQQIEIKEQLLLTK